jgi:hypothetical protein
MFKPIFNTEKITIFVFFKRYHLYFVLNRIKNIHNYLNSITLSNNIYFLLKKLFYLFKVSVLKVYTKLFLNTFNNFIDYKKFSNFQYNKSYSQLNTFSTLLSKRLSFYFIYKRNKNIFIYNNLYFEPFLYNYSGNTFKKNYSSFINSFLKKAPYNTFNTFISTSNNFTINYYYLKIINTFMKDSIYDLKTLFLNHKYVLINLFLNNTFTFLYLCKHNNYSSNNYYKFLYFLNYNLKDDYNKLPPITQRVSYLVEILTNKIKIKKINNNDSNINKSFLLNNILNYLVFSNVFKFSRYKYLYTSSSN